MSVLDNIANELKSTQEEVMSLNEYLELCKNDRMAYANAHERMLEAIGEPKLVDTNKDSRLGRIFQNKTLKIYPAFEEFYGLEETIEKIVGFIKHAAQGLEEKKQILYLLGPVGTAKSSLAEKLKSLMEVYPIYILTYNGQMSPVFESPLGLFNPDKHGDDIESEYGIPKRYLSNILSPWALKRLDEANGDITQFTVTKVYPSKLRQIAVVKTEPGDENNQDISNLVGKLNIRMLEEYDQNDPDAYSFSGALQRGNQGIIDFVEMFKAPIKMLHPLLTATQEGNYAGTEDIGAMPFSGMIVAHSNESEWQSFKSNKNNEAFLDRIYLIKVPYCLRVDEEVKIYQKMLNESDLKDRPCAPDTLELLAQFAVLTRLKTHENSNLYTKMRVYNGENIKDVDPSAKSIHEYKEQAGPDEGMSGISTRFAFKILSRTFNFDSKEVAADPVHLFYVLEDEIKQEQFDEETEKQYLSFIKSYLAEKYNDKLGKEIQKCYMESYKEYGQNLFERYVDYADSWLQDQDYKDPDTGQIYDKEYLNKELEKIEKPAGVANPKDFRNEIVQFVLRTERGGETKVYWDQYEKIRDVIEKKMFTNTEEILPVISFSTKQDSETERKHREFVDRMKDRGYTEKQIKRLVDYYMRVKKSG